MFTNKLKWIAGLVWILFLGGIGSGLWELFFRPIFYWCGGAILSVTTLGLSSLKDNLYVSVAQEQHELGIMVLISLLISGLLGIGMGLFSSRLRQKRAIRLYSNRDEIEIPVTRLKWFSGEKSAIFMLGVVGVIFFGELYQETYTRGHSG